MIHTLLRGATVATAPAPNPTFAAPVNDLGDVITNLQGWIMGLLLGLARCTW